MARVNQKLVEALETRLKVSRRQVYRLISRKVNETHLPRPLAAISLASDLKMNISRFATEQDLAEIRSSGKPVSPGPLASPASTPASTPYLSLARGRRSIMKQRKRGVANSVFVVHGRDEKLRRAMFVFLRALGLKPIEWRKAIEYTKKPAPYVGEILDAAFARATAVVVLFTPDDEARLRPAFQKPTDPPYEKRLTDQPRPNVLFEAGMAFGSHPNSTVLVQVGEMRPFGDIAGRHAVHLTNAIASRQEFVTKLRACGCDVDDSGTDWTTEGDFTPTASQG